MDSRGSINGSEGSELKRPLLSSTRSITNAIEVKQGINIEVKPDIKHVLKKLTRRERFNQCGEYLYRHQNRFTILGTLLIAGIAFEILWTQYYLPQNEKISNWKLDEEDYRSQYNASDCPGTSYWYHPEVAVTCSDSEGKWSDFNRLLFQDDYCFTGSNQACHSPFAEEKIEQLSAVCEPIMRNLCNVLGDLDIVNFTRFFAIALLVFIPFISSIIWVCCMLKMSEKLGALTMSEQREAKETLAHYGIEETRPDLYYGSLTRLFRLEGIQKIIEDANILPGILTSIILDYVDRVSREPQAQAIIGIEWKRAERNRVSGSMKKSRFYELFKGIQPDCHLPHTRPLDNHHCREDLNSESVAKRIRTFVG